MEILRFSGEVSDADGLCSRLKIHEFEDRREFQKMLDLASKIALPKAVYLEGYVDERGEDFVIINGVRFTSNVLKKNLDKIDRVFVYIATCGKELDSVNFSGDFLKEYWWDEIKACYLNVARKGLIEYLKKRFLLKKTATMVPGGGESGIWPIEQQKELFSLFGNVEELIGVKRTDSFLMIPNKSVSGILFPVEKDYSGCMLCRRKNCPGRSAEFDENLWKTLGEEAGLNLKK